MWASLTFAQPKMSGDSYILTNFRKLSECIERKSFLLPRIDKAIQKLENSKSATASGPFSRIYCIPIDEEGQKSCTTTL